ncbi:hypothetical protein GCM10010339_83150 [Streptomyces alanosinicus]|uniref:Secreted protein n=1 Tax=Streptomyces alanosinicus TaxID=68171 RepID=A0A918YRK9_9ACTN|nr:hypothetical protein GCM10010339_83150 [Streptomyces alanosinicus]
MKTIKQVLVTVVLTGAAVVSTSPLASADVQKPLPPVGGPIGFGPAPYPYAGFEAPIPLAMLPANTIPTNPVNPNEAAPGHRALLPQLLPVTL